MIIHAYILCYNEERIIKQVLDYYSSLCDKIFLLDNYSTDKSVEIAREYKNVDVIPFDSCGKLDDRLHVKLKSQLYKKYSRDSGVDWVICCDMDEILYHKNLKMVLSEYKKMGITVPAVTGFNMVSDIDFDEGKELIKQFRFGVREPIFDKRIVFSPEFDMSYSLGCHPYGSGFEHMKSTWGYSSSNQFPIALLHYKHIGKRLVDVAKSSLSRVEANQTSTPQAGIGSHYKTIIDSGIEISPLFHRRNEVLDETLNVLFEDFAPSTAEEGAKKPHEKELVTQQEVDIIRNAAVLLDEQNQNLAVSLMKIAARFRPSGAAIRQFILDRSSKV